MKGFIPRWQSTVLAIVMGATLNVFAVTAGYTQERHRVSGKMRAENVKYTQQYTIDVGDVAGHQIRLFELRHPFAQDGPIFEGVRTLERWTRGFTDVLDHNGSGEVYTIYLLENGDKVFAKGRTVVQAATSAAESPKSKVTDVSRITGGTGKFLGIRGIIDTTGVIDPKANFAELQFAGEYWLQK